MSEAASIPFSETKAPESPDRLNKGALRLVDISASTMANIGPAYSFYFSAGFLFLTAGIAAPPEKWNEALPHGKGGRIEVGPDLRVAGQERVFSIGDVSISTTDPVAQLSAPAIQQGRHAGRQVRRLLAGQPTTPFAYHYKGIMATIGRRSAVVELRGGLRLRGTIAWFAWLGLHLFYLLGGRNRVVTLVNLAWRYLTWSRGGGVILGDDVPETVDADHR